MTYRGQQRKIRSPFGAQLDQILDQVFLNRIPYAVWFCKPDRGQNEQGIRLRNRSSVAIWNTMAKKLQAPPGEVY